MPQPAQHSSRIASATRSASMRLSGSLSERHLLRSLSSAERKYGGAHGDADTDQDQAETESEGQIAFAGFEHDRRRHGAGVPGDIAAHDENGANLGDGPPETGEGGRKNENPFHGEQVRDRAQTARAVDHQSTAILSPRILDGPMSERRHDRCRERGLG